MRWFGKPHRAPVYREIERTATPECAPCAWCQETIVEGDDGFEIPSAMFFDGDRTVVFYHRNCFLRSVLGSVSHIWRQCSCYVPGSSCSDPEGMTRRQAAEEAVAEYERLEQVPLR